MYKNTSILAFVIATILTTSIAALTLSNQAFAQDQIPFAGSGGGANFVGRGAILGNDVPHTLPVIIKHPQNPPPLGKAVKILTVGIAFFILPQLIPIIANAAIGGGAVVSQLNGAIINQIIGQPGSNSGQLGQILAAHETQQANEQATGLLGGINSHAEGTNTIDGVLTGGQEQQGQTTTTGTGNLGSTAPSGDTGSGSILGSTNQPCSSSSINSITVRNQDSGFDLIPCIVH